MKIKQEYKIIALFFFLSLAVRLIFAFQTPHFTTDRAYFNLEQIEVIKNDFFPNFYDELSYSGRNNLFLPLFHCILAFFSLFIPINLVAKIMPNIFASSIVIIAYLISFEITKSKRAALFASFISAFVPVFMSETINRISVYSLVIPLSFYIIYCLMKINEKKYLYQFIILMMLLSLISSSSLLIIFGSLVYLLLIKLGNLKRNKEEIEVIIFSSFFIAWLQFIIFKKAFLAHGIYVIWQNIPSQILVNYFREINILEAVYKIGSIPLIYGFYAIYDHLFRKRERKVYLLIGFAISTAFLLWFKFIKLNFGLSFLGIIVVLLFSQFCNVFFNYVRKTRFARFKNIFFMGFIFAFALTSVLPSIAYAWQEIKNAPSQGEIEGLLWLKENAAENGIVIGDIEDGFLINAVAKRKNVMDSNFLLIKNSEEIFRDIKTMFITPYATIAIEILNKYDSKYIYFSKNAKKNFGIERLKYVDYKGCFELRYSNEVEIYELKCELKVEK